MPRHDEPALSACGLTIAPTARTVTDPAGFERLFPATGGALYGRASHGWMASFRRPGARRGCRASTSRGGSVHPGPGVPMAAQSGGSRRRACCRTSVRLSVPAGGYAWWYVDGVSDDGRHGITVIAFLGSVFSPYYAWSRDKDPIDHSAVNVVLYGRPKAGR